MKIENGKETSVWYDKWCEIGPLSQLLTRRDLYDVRFDANSIVADMVYDNQWVWSNELSNRFPEITNIPIPNFTNDRDKAIWKDNNANLQNFSVKQVWVDYKERHPKV